MLKRLTVLRKCEKFCHEIPRDFGTHYCDLNSVISVHAFLSLKIYCRQNFVYTLVKIKQKL